MNFPTSIIPAPHATTTRDAPLVCFSHLRWDFVLQRPQHLMARFAKERRVFYFEEFIPTDHHLAYLEIHPFEGTTVKSVRPRIPQGWSAERREQALGKLVDELLGLCGAQRPILWFYTPMMYSFARHVAAAAVVYDCMDELANFKFAPPEIKTMEAALIARADVVFTGGYSLYEAKCHQHGNMHPFPSSVDANHFRSARLSAAEPSDQRSIPGPRLGYYGVIDERLDLALIGAVAQARPDLSFVFIGPLAKITPDDLPRAANLHYLGQKPYSDLPLYLAGWEVALMPFALNEATKFISPTKTPEYLASGRPVVTTPIKDVVRHYGTVPGVFVAGDAQSFARACDNALALKRGGTGWLAPIDAILTGSSWDETFLAMRSLLEKAIVRAESPEQPRTSSRQHLADAVAIAAQ